MWFEDGGTDKNTGRRAGGGEVEHVKLFIGSDQDGHQVIKSGDKVEMVRTCEEERPWIDWTSDVEDEVTIWEEKSKTTEEVYV